ncbi:MAG: aldose epimerase family protein [Bacteroidota bacterium]
MIDIKEKNWGSIDGKDVNLYTLVNDKIEIKITNYGGIVTSVLIPSDQGQTESIVLGFDNLEQYLGEHPYLGAICGRYANRIAKGSFRVDTREYQLPRNNGKNCLHGGIEGFDKKVWDSKAENNKLILQYISPDMEEGFPGNLQVKVIYELTDDNELLIEYEAVTDKTTHVNLTNHSYFNLNGCKRDVLDHELQLHAERYTDIDDENIPTGKIFETRGTALDFTSFRKLGERIHEVPDGYDHNYVLGEGSNEPELTAILRDSSTGRSIEMFTTEPGVQLYTGNFLDGKLTGIQGVAYNKQYGVCLEAQHYPDTPNHPEFPPTLLEPGDIYRQKTIYKFNY